MKLRKDHRGFSLVELVIVAGIVAIIASMSLIIINRLRVANTEKIVKSITTQMTKQQMKSMSKENKPYLYIYMTGSEYYVILSEEDSYNNSTMGTRGTKLGSGFSIYYNMGLGGADVLVDDTHPIRIAYKKDGTFMGAADNVPKTITVSTSARTTTIKINREIGKFVIE